MDPTLSLHYSIFHYSILEYSSPPVESIGYRSLQSRDRAVRYLLINMNKRVLFLQISIDFYKYL